MKAPEVIVGLGGLLSNAGCCVIKRGEIASAIEQSKVAKRERFEPFPEEAFQTALETARVTASEIECIAVARPFSRSAESDTLLSLRSRFPQAEIVVVEHHAAHAASAYFASGFQESAVLSIDRAGDYRSAVLYRAEGRQLSPVRELYFPDSLGDLFNRVTELLGYQSGSDEHKVQWLSTTADPVYKKTFLELLNGGSPGWPKFDRSYLASDRHSREGFSRKFFEALGLQSDAALPVATQAAIAASLQQAVNDTVAAMIGPVERVSIAGGLALNALLIASLEQKFKHVFVQPAAGNAGTALGAAFHAWHIFYGQDRRIPFDTLCLGPEYPAEEIKRVLENCKLRFQFLLTENEVIERAIQCLSDGKIVAWMHGRMEFGPRALGNRSILASPLNPYSSENLNAYIKHRESFRKFAASVPAEIAGEFFEVGENARFLATVGRVKSKHKKTFEAALLGTELIRVQTVQSRENP